MIVCGVDEAGRGPVIGPLVICGLCADEDEIKNFNVKDSKLLSPKRREYLFDKIISTAKKYVIKIIPPEKLDEMMREMTINEIEEIYFAEIIDELKPQIVIVDAVDVDEKRFEENLKKRLKFEIKIISKHKADRDYPIVSAASIIAKVTRDREIEKIKKEIGDFGSGYPADPRTMNFLMEYYKNNGSLPKYVRKTWKTVRKILNSKSNLDRYG